MDAETTLLLLSLIFAGIHYSLIRLTVHPLVAFLASGGLLLTVAAIAEAL